MGLRHEGFDHASVLFCVLTHFDVLLDEVGVALRSEESVELLLLVAKTVLFNHKLRRQVHQQALNEFIRVLRERLLNVESGITLLDQELATAVELDEGSEVASHELFNLLLKDLGLLRRKLFDIASEVLLVSISKLDSLLTTNLKVSAVRVEEFSLLLALQGLEQVSLSAEDCDSCAQKLSELFGEKCVVGVALSHLLGDLQIMQSHITCSHCHEAGNGVVALVQTDTSITLIQVSVDLVFGLSDLHLSTIEGIHNLKVASVVGTFDLSKLLVELCEFAGSLHFSNFIGLVAVDGFKFAEGHILNVELGTVSNVVAEVLVNVVFNHSLDLGQVVEVLFSDSVCSWHSNGPLHVIRDERLVLSLVVLQAARGLVNDWFDARQGELSS